MTVDQFRANTEGKQIDLDHYPAAQPYQCVDEVSDYNELVMGGGRFSGNAKDIFGQYPELYNWFTNTPAGVPTKGSVFVYGPAWGGGSGHCGVVLSADRNVVTLLEQNVAAPRVTVGTHNYNGSIGWGVPRKDVIGAPVATGGRYQAVRTANVRVAPHVNAGLGGSQVLHAGDWFDASGSVQGDSVSGNNIWIQSLRGNFVWSGNLVKVG